MTTSVRLGAIALDAADPAGLGVFYERMLGWTRVFANDDFVALTDGSIGLTIHRVAEHQGPEWPGPAKQMHLDLAVTDLEEAVAWAVSCGATVADHQPRPEAWRVLVDPAGHPFCLSAQIPDFASMISA